MIAGLAPVIARLAGCADAVAEIEACAAQICEVFGAERLTLYLASADGGGLHAKVQTGLGGFKPIKLPLTARSSVAGYAGEHRRLVNVPDAYDDRALAAFQPPLKFLKAVDSRTGFRTREILAAPLVGADGRLAGVLQLLNRTDQRPFPRETETALAELCSALAGAFAAEAVVRRERFGALLGAATARLMDDVLFQRLGEDALREDAPAALADLREQTLQLFRVRVVDSGHLDIFDMALKRLDPPNADDFAGLQWLARLAKAGHAGAQRLCDCFFYGMFAEWHAFDVAVLEPLAAELPVVAAFLADREASRDRPDLRAVLRFLEQAGGASAAVGAAIGGLVERWPGGKAERIIREHMRHARGHDARLEPDRVARAEKDVLVALSELSPRRAAADTGAPAAAAPTGRKSDLDTILDLAAAYRSMGDLEGARELLNEVLERGDPRQCGLALELLEKLDTGGRPAPSALT